MTFSLSIPMRIRNSVQQFNCNDPDWIPDDCVQIQPDGHSCQHKGHAISITHLTDYTTRPEKKWYFTAETLNALS